MTIHGIDLSLELNDPELKKQFEKLDAGSDRSLFCATVNQSTELKEYNIDVPSTVNCNWEVLEKYLEMRIKEIDQTVEITSLMYKHR